MNKIFILTFFFIFTSCSSLVNRKKTAEYTIFTSLDGAKVYRSDGKDLGETPLVMKWEDVEEVIDGNFVSLIVDKPGYFTRVIFFDASQSVNLKIDLEIDRDYKDKRKNEIQTELSFTRERNQELISINKTYQNDIAQYKKQQEVILNNMSLLAAKSEEKTFDPSSLLKELTSKIGSSTPNAVNASINKPAKARKTKTVYKKILYPQMKTNSVIRQLLSAQFLIINSNLAKARELVLKIEEKHPRVGALYTLLAYIDSVEGNRARAKKYLKKSLAIDRNDVMAKRMLKIISQPKRIPAKNE